MNAVQVLRLAAIVFVSSMLVQSVGGEENAALASLAP